MCLEFCEKCNSIMVLKERNGKSGTFICRHCQALKNAPIEKIEITEKVKEPSLEQLLLIQGRAV